MSTRSFLVLCLLCGTLAQANAQQAVLTAIRDNTLYQTADGSTSNGSGEYLFVGKTNAGSLRRALVRFDVSPTIPAGSTVTSVTLRLNLSKTASTTDRTITLFRVTADWGEGTSDAGANEGSGASSTTNDATWNHRFFPSATWTNPGGDRSGTPSASVDVTTTGAYTWGSTTQLVSDVQGWVNDPSTNFGWILIGDEGTNQTSKRFDSRENATAGNRPTLTVQYTTSTSVKDGPTVPQDVTLEGNFPNPFNPSTQIRFSVPSSQSVRLTIVNLLGIKVATLVDGPTAAGSHTVAWDASGMPSGLYFVRLEAGGRSAMKRMVLAK